MAGTSRTHLLLLFAAAIVVAFLDTSCSWEHYVYDLETFTPQSPALIEAKPSVRLKVPAHTELSGELERFARDHKSMEVETAGIIVECFPAIQSAETQGPVACLMLVTNNTQHEIVIDEQNIAIAHNLALGGTRKRKPISVACAMPLAPLRPIKPNEHLPVVVEFEKDNTKRESTLQFTIRTGDNKDFTYAFTFKGKNPKD